MKNDDFCGKKLCCSADSQHQVAMAIPRCGVTLGEIADRVVLAAPGETPRLIVLGSVCRSGGSALLNSFAAANYRGVYQPMKSILRCLSRGCDAQWVLPDGEEPLIIKEAFGPYYEEECLLDPVEILLRKGIRPDKITFVSLLRHPEQVAASWRQWFWDRPGLPRPSEHGFLAAFLQPEVIRERCDSLGIATTTFRLEDILALGASTVLRMLFDRLNLHYSDKVIDWTDVPPLGSENSLISWISAPYEFRVPQILDGVKLSRGFRYVPRANIQGQADWLSDSTRELLGKLYREASVQAPPTP